ncbi:MAG: hypothetical protein V7767_04210 [Leeuwenhoekiella sp.]
MKKLLRLFLLVTALLPLRNYGQAEFTTWGNLTGIRVNNQLMEFETSLAFVKTDYSTWETRKEGQNTDFTREGADKIFSYEMGDAIRWKNKISSPEAGKASVSVQFSSKVDTLINGAFFRLKLPKEYDEDTSFKITSAPSFSLSEINTTYKDANYKVIATGIDIKSPKRQLSITFEKPTELIIENDSINSTVEIDFKIAAGSIKAEEIFSNTFTIKATGEIDKSPVMLKIFPEQEGAEFDGIGGNFRLQNPKMDPQVIDYSLENLRVAWSRVEMPWRQWNPDETTDPIAEAKKGNIDPKVKASLEMAQRLDKMGIPVILAAWFAPDWAIVGERVRGVNLDGSRGNALDQNKKEAIYKSITSYIKYLKEEYGVKTVMFSFNESDLGIDVRQTPEEHNMLIKELGRYFKKEGLGTKFFLGDNSDANSWDFTTVASMDPETRPFIGGVSFHSWRGWTDENLIKWRDIANRVGAPLFVGEGSIDAGAWRYPLIFEEPTYALDEIDVYIKILKIAQPLTILQWQLTSDYSVLSGGGLFGNTMDKLYPQQRFFNLKQLGSTPKGLKSIPLIVDKDDVRCAAFGSRENGTYAIHMVNKGATRQIKIAGLPVGITDMIVYVTNQEKSFEKEQAVKVINGQLSFELDGASFVSLFSE